MVEIGMWLGLLFYAMYVVLLFFRGAAQIRGSDEDIPTFGRGEKGDWIHDPMGDSGWADRVVHGLPEDQRAGRRRSDALRRDQE